MKRNLLWLFLLLPFCVQAQISGRLLDSETHEPIPYVQISIAHPKAQTYSTENGRFSFSNLDKNNDYLLQIEALGYFYKEIHSSELNDNSDILLDLNADILPELYIIPENAKTKIRTYGQTREGSLKTSASFCGNYSNTEYLNLDKQEISGTELGLLAKNKGLSKALSAHLFVGENDFDKAIIKIQLYDASSGDPTNPIIHEPIIFNITDKQTGWFKINLEDKNIYIDSSIKKIALMAILVQSEGEGCLALSGIFPSISHWAIVKDFESGQLIKAPFSFPLYLTVETYSW